MTLLLHAFSARFHVFIIHVSGIFQKCQNYILVLVLITAPVIINNNKKTDFEKSDMDLNRIIC